MCLVSIINLPSFYSSPFQHRSTICAIRETEVVEMSRELFHIVAHSCPEVFQHVTQNLSVKFMEKNQRSSSKLRNENQRRDNIATIALLPITDHAPVAYLVQVRRKEKDNYSLFVVVVFTLFVLTLVFHSLFTFRHCRGHWDRVSVLPRFLLPVCAKI